MEKEKVQIRKRDIGHGIYECTVLYCTAYACQCKLQLPVWKMGHFPTVLYQQYQHVRGSRCPILRLIPEDGGEWKAHAKLVGCCLSSRLSCFLSPLLSYLLSSLFSLVTALPLHGRKYNHNTHLLISRSSLGIPDIQPSTKKHPSKCLSKRCRATSETVGVALRRKTKKQNLRRMAAPGPGTMPQQGRSSALLCSLQPTSASALQTRHGRSH